LTVLSFFAMISPDKKGGTAMDNQKETKEKLTAEEMKQVNGGAGSSSRGSGYCPYTPDRTCHTDKGGWSDCETCQECGWRAW